MVGNGEEEKETIRPIINCEPLSWSRAISDITNYSGDFPVRQIFDPPLVSPLPRRENGFTVSTCTVMGV